MGLDKMKAKKRKKVLGQAPVPGIWRISRSWKTTSLPGIWFCQFWAGCTNQLRFKCYVWHSLHIPTASGRSGTLVQVHSSSCSVNCMLHCVGSCSGFWEEVARETEMQRHVCDHVSGTPHPPNLSVHDGDGPNKLRPTIRVGFFFSMPVVPPIPQISFRWLFVLGISNSFRLFPPLLFKHIYTSVSFY